MTILIPFALSFLAQTPAKPVPIAGDDFVGAGQVVDRKPAVPKDAAAWRREIARAQLLFEVDGKLQPARDDILRTWEALLRSEKFEGRREVALEALDLGSRILLRLGETDAVDALFDPKRQGALASELAGMEKDPRFVYSRQKVAIARGKANPDASRIDMTVLDALRAKNSGVLQELGAAAAPTFERLVRETPDAFKPIDEDPLYYLVGCAPERASIVCRDLLAQPGLGFLVAKRVMRAMTIVKPPVLDGSSTTWRFGEATALGWSERAPTLVVTAWRDVTTALLGIPVAAGEALAFAKQLSMYDALDAPLRAAVLQVARSEDAGLQLELARSLASRGLRPTVEPLLLDLLDTPSAEVRAVAAEELARGPRSERLLAKITDPDPRVRASIASALQPGQLQRIRYSRTGFSFEATTVERTFDDRDRPLLERLLADESPEVRTAALSAASNAEIRLTPELTDRLSKDPDVEVRREVVRLLPRTAADAAPFLERLLADTDAKVRSAASLVLHERYGIFQRPNGIVSEPVAEPASPALRALAIAQLVPGPAEVVTSGLRWPLVRRLLADPDDARELVRAFLAAPPNPNIAAQAMWHGLVNGERAAPRSIRFLDAESVHALLVRTHGEQPDLDSIVAGLDRVELEAAAQTGIARFVADPAMSRRWRLTFWNVIANTPNAEALLLSTLTKPTFGTEVPSIEVLDALDKLGRRAEPGAVLGNVLTQVFDLGLPDGVIARLAQAAIKYGGSPSALAKRLLERLDKSTDPRSHSVRQWAVQQEADQGHWDSVRVALEDPITLFAALNALGHARPPQGLAWLGAYLHDSTQEHGVIAAGAIAGYLSEDAAEILLRGAELAPTAEVRKACLDGVAEIRAFLDQKASWQQRSTGAKQRDAAVAELAGMLDSKDPGQRAEAARGLATLQGVEHLPRLVRMLQDPDPQVRAAVQESLGRLNAPR